jgi:hypothetical protein
MIDIDIVLLLNLNLNDVKLFLFVLGRSLHVQGKVPSALQSGI